MSRASRSSEDPGRPTARYLDAYRRLAPAWHALWPGTLDGTDHIPDHDRYLLVANHSGLGIVECVTLVGSWTSRFGADKPLSAMAHSSLFRLPVLGDALRGLGTVEATKEGADWARERGSAILLFPGGEHESMRSIWAAHEVDFAGRKGWIRLARLHGLTIVPLAITGSHVTIPNLGRLDAPSWLRELLGVRRLPLPLLSTFAATMAFALTPGSMIRRTLAAIAGFSAFALVPWVPSRIGFRLLEPIRDMGKSDDEIYDQVVDALARELALAPLRRPIRV